MSTTTETAGLSFELPEDVQSVREMVRDFAESEIRPIAARIDETHEFPAENTKKMAELGLLGMFVPEQWGGAGMSYLAYVVAIEELSRVCASHGVIASVNNSLVCYPLMQYANDEQKRRWLAPLAKGELLGAYCLTEPNAGSNAANQQTTAVLDGDHWVLNGSKIFITNAGPADVLITYAATDKALGPKGISAFIVPADIPGVKKGKKEHALPAGAATGHVVTRLRRGNPNEEVHSCVVPSVRSRCSSSRPAPCIRVSRRCSRGSTPGSRARSSRCSASTACSWTRWS
ncbi:MAG: acyl-CoA dehydrogenase family protein, partial [bacterium]